MPLETDTTLKSMGAKAKTDSPTTPWRESLTILKVIYTKRNLGFLPKPNEEKLVLSAELPPAELCTAIVVLAFDQGRILLNNNKKWNWSLPAGHIEKGETLEEAARREVWEETQVKLGKMDILGYVHFHIGAPKPSGYKYPHPDSYMVYYCAQVTDVDDFLEDSETSDRGFFSKDELRQNPKLNKDINWDLYEEALRLIR